MNLSYYIILLKLQHDLSYLTGTTSSILSIILTHSVDNAISDVFTKRGCTTCSDHISDITPLFTLIPVPASPPACRFLNSVTREIGLIPAFSARVYGIISKAYDKLYCYNLKIRNYYLINKFIYHKHIIYF